MYNICTGFDENGDPTTIPKYPVKDGKIIIVVIVYKAGFTIMCTQKLVSLCITIISTQTQKYLLFTLKTCRKQHLLCWTQHCDTWI